MADTLFKLVNYSLNGLINFIDLGQIGLPDIQRPFVWPNKKVRDLFDSIYRGYPVGYLLFWQNAFDSDVKTIGKDGKQKAPNLLIVDGQQRLTSLYAVIKGVPVIRDNYSEETIEIAFNPLLERFEVSDAAIRRDPSFIPNISTVWANETDIFDLVDLYLERLTDSRDVSDDENKQIKKAISRLNNIEAFPFTALELSANIDEVEVSEVFVRVNSKGTPLNQADFILTLMSVFWDEGRKQLEAFCRDSRTPSSGAPSSFNHFVTPDPDQLLRVTVGLAFKRARLQFVYSILRGKDLETGEFSEDRRDQQFELLRTAQEKVLNLAYWHDFLQAILHAGYRGGRWISSPNSLMYTYILYLIGRTEYKVDLHTLRRIVAQWFFMVTLTGRYTSSPESAMESDLARLRAVKTGDEFIDLLEQICATVLTSDYWSISLPSSLATSASRSPSLFAYYASLAQLNAKALYSSQSIMDLVEPSVHSSKSSVERHHLYPKGYLNSIGINEASQVNQIANYALVEWGDNIAISDQAPSDYVSTMENQFLGHELQQMYKWHALPDGWYNLEYSVFLEQRRELLAAVIREAYAKLSGEKEISPNGKNERLKIGELALQGESPYLEYKGALRTNLHTKQSDPRIELSALKTIAGFINSTTGGTLLIGVSDDGLPIGIHEDGFANEDKMLLHLDNLIRDRLGAKHVMYIHPHFEDFEDVRVLAIECSPGASPVFVKDGSTERFYIRMGASTFELRASETHDYVKERFRQ